jgi:DNA-binding NtrC family response regulator
MAKNNISILIVEDEKNTREGLFRLLKNDYEVSLAEDGYRAIKLIEKNNYDIVLTDLKMPGGTGGMDVLNAALAKKTPATCIILTAYGSIESAVAAMRAGAFDFISKPVNLDQLEMVIKRAVESRKLRLENIELKKRLNQKFGFDKIIGNSSAMHEVFETVKQVAPTKTTVLITGESGTGKELIAQSIHQLSGRSGPFIAVNCSALPASLLESELFGHEKGAFTGATEQKKGRFELADSGTLFLDEIGEIDLSVQVKLLRVLETRTFERVGGVETIRTGARILTATNKDLRQLVAEKKFREDLYYRLVVVSIHLPPLRERVEDIPLIINHFIKEFSEETGIEKKVSEEVVNILSSYSWPGNVRELKNCVERMFVLCRGTIIQPSNIPPHILNEVHPNKVTADFNPTTLNLKANEIKLIIKALEKTGGNKSKAAELLGISRRTLHRKLIEYNIESPEKQGD